MFVNRLHTGTRAKLAGFSAWGNEKLTVLCFRMDPKIINRLAGTPPPPRAGKLRFSRVLEAHAEIERLETLLEISHCKPSMNIIQANLRISELQSLVGRKPRSPAAAGLHGLARASAAVKIAGPAQIPFSGAAKTGRERMKRATRIEGQKI